MVMCDHMCLCASTVDADPELSDMWVVEPNTDGRETIVPPAKWSDDDCDR
jgi:hypothetical protein